MGFEPTTSTLAMCGRPPKLPRILGYYYGTLSEVVKLDGRRVNQNLINQS